MSLARPASARKRAFGLGPPALEPCQTPGWAVALGSAAGRFGVFPDVVRGSPAGEEKPPRPKTKPPHPKTKLLRLKTKPPTLKTKPPASETKPPTGPGKLPDQTGDNGERMTEFSEFGRNRAEQEPIIFQGKRGLQRLVGEIGGEKLKIKLDKTKRACILAALLFNPNSLLSCQADIRKT